ncbi:MAG: putative ATP-dependent helicase DinG [Candidatus Erwinia impunctatus]|nr:putative ATP-dependent helicase DinG [Culicoides impunctatus]
MVLTAAVKKQIADWYKALQEQIPDFISRLPQRQMIAEVAKTLAGEAGRHLAIEAPTGVGKTFSYLIPGIAVGRAEQKPLIISTANVALQDQILSKDLPLLQKVIPGLTYTAALGRRRYLCPRNLTMLRDDDQYSFLLALFDEPLTTTDKERQCCDSLYESYRSGAWDGVRDHWKKMIDDPLWHRLSTDRNHCLAAHCQWFRECPYFRARQEIEQADVVVANHALVMAAMESESLLPPVKNILLVVDEGHHFAEVARDALMISGDITLRGVTHQLDLFCQSVAQYLTLLRPQRAAPLSDKTRLEAHCEEVCVLLSQLAQLLRQQLSSQMSSAEYRFVMGILPEEIQQLCQQLWQRYESLRSLAEALLTTLNEKTGHHDLSQCYTLMIQLSQALSGFESATKLWQLAQMEQASGAPVSKWVTVEYRDGEEHLWFHCAGIRVSEQLEKKVWRKIPHIVLTSATLQSLNSFRHLQEMTGLNEKADDRFIALPTPFNHCTQGKLLIPQMEHEPSLAAESQHIEEMAQFFCHRLQQDKHKGILVLFSSARAMKQFITALPALRLEMLVQGDKPRNRLIALHRQRVTAGERSILVGLQSFAEGLDLKGELLSQVHIHKIAFPPVDSPLILTEGEWLRSIHRYPFEVQSLPAASFNLIQQVGRLIRSNHCYGEIIIYDRRLLSKAYGRRLLNALPVFPIQHPPMPQGCGVTAASGESH